MLIIPFPCQTYIKDFLYALIHLENLAKVLLLSQPLSYHLGCRSWSQVLCFVHLNTTLVTPQSHLAFEFPLLLVGEIVSRCQGSPITNVDICSGKSSQFSVHHKQNSIHLQRDRNLRNLYHQTCARRKQEKKMCFSVILAD